NTVNTALGFESGIIIVVVAIILDRTLRMGGK
ncbi:MAG: choline ABC transporter permease subunit, partial [Cypionkella sp.]